MMLVQGQVREVSEGLSQLSDLFFLLPFSALFTV